MRSTWILGILTLPLIFIGCTKQESSGPKTEDASNTRNDAVQKLYARKDEFAAMKPPPLSKPTSEIGVYEAFIMFKLPGFEYEVVGFEKDQNGNISLCNSDKCNNRDIFPLRNRMPKWVDDSKVSYLVRADCKEGKKLAELNISGSLFESDCEVNVINLNNNTTVSVGRAVTKMPEPPYKGAGLDIRSYATKGDKSYLVPIRAIDEYLKSVTVESRGSQKKN